MISASSGLRDRIFFPTLEQLMDVKRRECETDDFLSAFRSGS